MQTACKFRTQGKSSAGMCPSGPAWDLRRTCMCRLSTSSIYLGGPLPLVCHNLASSCHNPCLHLLQPSPPPGATLASRWRNPLAIIPPSLIPSFPHLSFHCSPASYSISQQSIPSMTLLTCPECGRGCKNLSGLTCHKNAAHTHDPGLTLPVTELRRVYHP